MVTCSIPPHPEMYGLGIRIAVYIQWFGVVLIELLDGTLLRETRLLTLLTSAAIWLAIVIQVSLSDGAGGTVGLALAEIYLALLLATGVYLFHAPVWLWRLLTCCHPHYDPARLSRERPSAIFSWFNFVYLLALCGLAIWFWTTDVPTTVSGDDCDQWGFLFGRSSFANRGFVTFNAIVYFVILLVCVGIVIREAFKVRLYRREHRRRRASRISRVATAQLKALCNLGIASVLVTAIELTIQWNGIDGTQYVTTAAQLIPLLVSAVIVGRGFYLYMAALEVAGHDSDSSGHVTPPRSERRRVNVTEKMTTTVWGVRPPAPTARR